MNIKVFIALTFGFLVIGLAACSSATPTPSLVPTDTLVPTATSTPTPTPTSTSTPTSTPTAAPEPTPIGGGGNLLFVWSSLEHFAEEMSYADFIKLPSQIGYKREDYPVLRGDSNIFISDAGGANPIPLTTDGMDGYINLGDISPDGKKIFVFSYDPKVSNPPKFTHLYVVDLTGNGPAPQRITRFATGGAEWVNDHQIVYGVMNGGKKGLYLLDLNGGDPLLLTEGKRPLYIFSLGDGGVYWVESKEKSTSNGIMYEDQTAIWWSSLDGTVQRSFLTFNDTIADVDNLSPDGTTMVWGTRDFDNKRSVVNIALLEGTNNFNSIPAPAYINSRWPNWSPDSSKVFFNSDYGQAPASYIFDAYTCSFSTLPAPPARDDGFIEAISGGVWSPDSKRLIINTTYVDAKGWNKAGTTRVFDLASNSYSDALPITAFSGKWIPDPGQPVATADPATIETTLPCTYRSKMPPGQMKVFSNKAWQNTYLAVYPGDVVTVKYKTGIWGWTGERSNNDANGDPERTGAFWDICKKPANVCLVDAPLSSLIGRIGESGELFLIGNKLTFTIPADAPKGEYLFLMGNDNPEGLYDNEGYIFVELSLKEAP